MVAQQLQGNDVQQPLKTVDGSRYPNSLGIFVDRLVIFVADDNWLALASSNLR